MKKWEIRGEMGIFGEKNWDFGRKFGGKKREIFPGNPRIFPKIPEFFWVNSLPAAPLRVGNPKIWDFFVPNLGFLPPARGQSLRHGGQKVGREFPDLGIRQIQGWGRGDHQGDPKFPNFGGVGDGLRGGNSQKKSSKNSVKIPAKIPEKFPKNFL